MICAHCGYDDEGLNPFSKCLRCGLPFELPAKKPVMSGIVPKRVGGKSGA